MPETLTARSAKPNDAERDASASSIGTLLQYWRKAKNLSQLALAMEADVSPRHISFLETGRAKPSREIVVLLSTVLGVPLRERNLLLLAAGYAPVYREARLDAPELGPVRAALAAILRQQEPFPAIVMNRHWDILDRNQGAQRFFGMLLGAPAPPAAMNVLRLMFDPKGMRPHVENWEAVAEALLQRLHREATGGVKDAATLALLAEVLAYPDVPAKLRRPNLATPLLPVLPIRFRHGTTSYDFFSAVTTLGTPQDVTVEELRIECFFPASAETERRARDLAAVGGTVPNA
jgi:transcriptional regulator with XRE-family HTH domain